MFEVTLKKIMQSLVEASVDTGIADATSAVDHLDDASKSWPVDAFTDLIIEITSGTGEGQIRKISSNTATSIVPTVDFDTAPDDTSQYRIGFFGKMSGDITSWGGTALTGRDISLDLKALTDDSIKGILKSIGDVAALENLITRIGQTTDAIVAAGAEGSISAKLRRITQGLEDLKTLVVLAAGANIIGKVGIDQTTPGTTDRVTANLDKISGTAQTAADWTPLLQKLDVALSTRATENTLASVLAKLDVALSTRATEATLAKLMPTTPTKYAVALTLADTEYSQALPANTKKFRVHLRDYATFRLAYETGKVAGSVDPYETIPAGSEKYEDQINIASLTLYFASPVAGKTAEIEAWV
jgi:hypothetical protein